MKRETMSLAVAGDVATIVFERPAVLNCVDSQWLSDFTAALDAVVDDDRIGIVVLRGSGRAFCTGIDLTALSQGRIPDAFFRQWEEALRRIETMRPLAIAAVHSHCIGGGLQLALACDLRVARTDARFAITAVKEGILPGLGMWRLARYAGLGHAKRLALTAEAIDAATALEWGLIDYLAADAAFEGTLTDVIARLREMSKTSTRLTKRLLDMTFDVAWSPCLEVFCEYQRAATLSPEHRAAMTERRAGQLRRAAAGAPGDPTETDSPT